MTTLFLKMTFLTLLCLFLAGSSWAQQDEVPQSGNEEFLTPEQEIALEEEHSVASEPTNAIEEKEPAARDHEDSIREEGISHS